MKEFNYTIKDPLGIHARPASELVNAAKKHGCKISIIKGDKTVDAKQILGIMALGVKCGETIKLTFDGEGEETACESMLEFFNNHL